MNTRTSHILLIPSIALATILPVLVMGKSADHALIQLANHSGLPNEQVYFIAKAVDPNTNEDCFIRFDQDGIGECIAVTHNTLPSEYAYTVADFKDRILEIPRLDSGRLYVSLGYPLALYATKNDEGQIKIVSPDGFNPQDPSYYTLHDKIEFTYADNGFFINPTAVDFFSLPLQITNQSATGHLKASGLSISHADIYKRLHEMLAGDGTASKAAWQQLFVNFKHSNGVTPLRFMSPGKAMVDTNSESFDIHYLDNEPAYGYDYIQSLWDYYKTHTLIVDVGPKLGGLLTGGVNELDQFVFKNGPIRVALEKPTDSIPFFAGAGGPFEHENNTAKAVIVRELTSAFTVGLLPAPSGTVLGKNACSPENYFEQNKDKYYSINPLLERTDGPWYDLYGKALHSFNEPIYTFAYDDALCQDGTMHVDKEIDEPTLIILGDMNGIAIPNPYTQTFYPKVLLDVPPGRTVTYKDTPYTAGLFTLENVTTPVQVLIDDDPRTVAIYIEYPLIKMEPYSVSAYGIKIIPNEAKIIFPAGIWE